MQPYQEASQELQRQGEFPKRALQTGLSVAGSAAGGLALKNVLPFLSQYIPQDLAIKGLSKIDPRFGKFINKSMSEGKSFDEIKDFIKDKAKGGNEEKPQEQRNIIEQYSPELFQFLKSEVDNGRNPLEAAALARLPTKKNNFEKVIKKIEGDHKTDFSSIIQSIFGSAQQPQQAQPQQNENQNMQPQQGNSDQALMAALDKILKM